MPIYYNPCEDPVVDPQDSSCPETELGSIRSLFFVKSDYVFNDITNTQEWETAMGNRDIYVFSATRGTATPTENTTDGFGDQTQKLTGYTYVVNAEVQGYFANREFMQTIKNQSNFKVGWRTENYIHIGGKAATIVPKNPVGSITDQVNWMVDATFNDDDLTIPQIGPTGIFDQAFSYTP